MIDHTCKCLVDGPCPIWRREMHGNLRRVCAGASGVIPEIRQAQLQTWMDERDLQNDPEGLYEHTAREIRLGDARRSGVPCVHLGEPTGELRDCQTCQGNVRQKVFGCAIHGETTLKNCRQICRDYRPPFEEPGGLGEAHHEDDHYALSFSKAASMALYTGEGRTCREPVGMLRGQTAFLICGGPSLATVDLGRLRDRLTVAVNGVCEVFPDPTIWIAADVVLKFRGVPWHSEKTLKLIPRAWAGLDLLDGVPILECPNTRFYLRNACFTPKTFLSERTVNWGAEKPWGSGRSVMLAALKLLWYFGVARVVILGADFHMEAGRPYAHSEQKEAGACERNNDKFRILSDRLRQVRPFLEAAGMTVVNATEGGRLEAFERVSLDEEIAPPSHG